MNELQQALDRGWDLARSGLVPAAAAFLLDPGRADQEKADFLEALHRRGESPGEVEAFVREFLLRAVPFEVPAGSGPVLDVCGTGGDKLGLFNVSTTVMFILAAAGVRVVKHGNRGITSRSGGADVLEALGVAPVQPPEVLQRCLAEAGCVFLFAPSFHPAFAAVAGARKLLAAAGKASVFNMLGPLLNPARPTHQLAGVFSAGLMPIYAEVLPALGRRRGWVVHGSAGAHGAMDELSTLGPTQVLSWDGQLRKELAIDPAELGLSRPDLADLRGGEATDNARLLVELLEQRQGGARRDLVALNAAAALVVCGCAAGLAEALRLAGELIDSGAAWDRVERLRRAVVSH